MKVQRGRTMRLFAGTVAGAMALSITPLLGTNAAGAADPLPALADPVADGGVCENAPESNPFNDLGAESASTRAVILCLVATDLTAGTSATTYTPGGTVTRRQMALFIKRLADLVNELETGSPGLEELPAYDGVPDYTDVVAEDEVFQEAIGQLDQADIVGGFGDGTFRPGAFVSRRQMAAFVNRLQEFLTGTAFSTTNDYFDDDEGDSGEDDLNALASVGIFQGDGAGGVDPGDSLTRRQMANILLRHVQVLFAAGDITRPFPNPGNASLTITPTSLVTVVSEDGIDTTTPDDDRTYTASGLPAVTGGYQVTLVATDHVFQLSDGSYRFVEEGNTGLVDSGVLGARIVKVNGLNVAAHQTIGGIQPNNGTITFTVDGDGIESLVPIISVDGGTNTRLEIDDQGAPIETFGVGGQLNEVAAEASSGVNGDVVLQGPGYAVVDAATDSTVYFKAGDTYRIGAGLSFEEVTAAEFQAELSRGDTLATCSNDQGLPAAYTPGEANGYCLTDSAPENPADLTASAGTAPTTQIMLEWTAATPADSYNVYAYDRPCGETSVSELVAVASVPALYTSYEASSLDAGTTYCFVVTTVEDGDESPVAVGTGAADGDNTVEGATAAS